MGDWSAIRARDYLERRREGVVKRVRELRRHHALTQRDVASLLGCSPSRIARIEGGQASYRLEEIELLALLLGEQPASLLKPAVEMDTIMATAYTNERTRPSLGDTLDCQLPPGVAKDPSVGHLFSVKLALSHDGCLLAGILRFDDDTEAVYVWDTRTGAISQVIALEDFGTAITFSPDGRLLAIGTGMDAVMLWDCAENQMVTHLDPLDDGYSEELWAFVNDCSCGYGVISEMRFSPDGRLLAVVNEAHGTLRLWDTRAWRQLGDTWALPEMFEELERERAPFKTVKEDGALPFGEFPVAHLGFTPDSRQIVVLPRLSKQLEYFSLAGKHLKGFMFPEMIRSYACLPLDEAGSDMLMAVGGEDRFFEAWYLEGGASQERLCVSSQEAGGDISQLVIVDEYCVLGLIGAKHRHRSGDLPGWLLVNLVSNQPVALLDVPPDLFDGHIQLSDDGTVIAYLAGDCIRVQQLKTEYLRMKGCAIPKGISRQIREQRLAGEELAWPAGGEGLVDYKVYDRSSLPANLRARLSEPANKTERELFYLKMATPSAEGGYGLAVLLPGDKTTVCRVLDKIRTETTETPYLVELPGRGAPVKVRGLIEYIAGRKLQHGEFTGEIVSQLQIKRSHSVIFIDNAEMLHEDALLWICANLELVTDVFILVTRDMEKFAEMAGRVPGGAAWALGRPHEIDLARFLE